MVAAFPAQADDSGTCDFYQNALIATKCARSVSIGVGFGEQFFNTHFSDSYIDAKTQSTDTSVLASVAVTPVSWLTLFYNGSNSAHSDSYQVVTAPGVTLNFPASGTFNSGRYWSFQNFGANATVYDSGPGSQRFLLNASASYHYLPAFAPYFPSEQAIGGSVTAAAQWRLGQSGYSINGLVGAGSSHTLGSASKVHVVGLTSHLLLSNDAAGIAIGPVIQSEYLVNGTNNSARYTNATYQNQIYSAGGMIVVAPFKASNTAILKDLVLEGSATHSLGPASLGTSSGTSQASSISGTAKFNFKY